MSSALMSTAWPIYIKQTRFFAHFLLIPEKVKLNIVYLVESAFVSVRESGYCAGQEMRSVPDDTPVVLLLTAIVTTVRSANAVITTFCKMFSYIEIESAIIMSTSQYDTNYSISCTLFRTVHKQKTPAKTQF